MHRNRDKLFQPIVSDAPRGVNSLLRGQTWPILIFIIHVKSIKPATTDLRKNLILNSATPF